MENKDSAQHEQQLRANPTVDGWSEEIRCILAGRRESNLREIGSVQQYVDRLLHDSDDPAKSQIMFRKALQNEVQFWQPEPKDNPRTRYFTGAILELIAAYTVPEGFLKVMGYLQQWGKFLDNESANAGPRKNLQSMALLALESYYPVPPPAYVKDPAFKKYEELLRKHLKSPGYEPHAFRRLLELGLINLEEDRLVSELVTRPGVVSEFLQHALGIGWRVLQKYVGEILAYCLDTRSGRAHGRPYWLFDEFKASLQRLGARLDYVNQSLILRLANGREIKLPLSAEARYREAMDREAIEAGRKKLESFIAIPHSGIGNEPPPRWLN